jgi:D-serine dehydratase
MLLGLATGLHDKISVNDIGLDNLTCADGLAVGRPSGFVGQLIQPFLDGCYTIEDQHFYDTLRIVADIEDLWLEPSALAGFLAPIIIFSSAQGKKYLSQFSIEQLNNSTHIAWATGGGMVPEKEMKEFYEKGCIS